MRTKIPKKELDDLFDEGARFRDTSQQIHKQWLADRARTFPTVTNVTNHGIASLTAGDASSSPVSTPSPSPSPTDSQRVTHNGTYEPQPKNVNALARNNVRQAHITAASSPHTTRSSQRTPGVGADSTAVLTNNNSKGNYASAGGATADGRVSEVMELYYVTERIIALWYKEDARGVLEHATSLLRGKHADNYMIFNLSVPEQTSEPNNTREVGWPQGLAPSLEKLCTLCKELDSWLNGATNRVVVLHSKGNKERLGVAVSAYMNYSSICGSRDQDRYALDRYAMRRFLDDKIGQLTVPSHRRYIEYFSDLLYRQHEGLRISPSILYLTHLTVLGVPLFEATGCRAFFKVYQGLTPVYTSDLYSVQNAREFTVNLGGLRLIGDILVKCYHRIYSSTGREVIFSLQFHTSVITENVVSFPRSELDVACNDPRCPPDSVVTLYFTNDASRQGGPVPAPTPAVPHASAHHDPILHWDSYTNLEISDDEGRDTPLSPPPASSSSIQTSPRGLGYTCGPIDGSLYAVVQQSGSGGARGSPLTVSMDSGISSAPPQRQSPPEIEAESQAHGDLDKLLHDMMLTVESMPDPPNDYNRGLRNGFPKMYNNYSSQNVSSQQQQPASSNYSTLKDTYRTTHNNSTKESSPPYNNYGTLKQQQQQQQRPEASNNKDYSRTTYDVVDYRDSPDRHHHHHHHHHHHNHHQNSHNNIKTTANGGDSFSPSGNIDYIDEDIPYHARQTSQPFSYGATPDMLKHQKLASPSLVRKAQMKNNNLNNNNNSNSSNGITRVVDFEDILSESNSRRPISPINSISPITPDPPPEFANGPAKNNVEPMDGMSWLKQQQMKLAARRDERSPAKIWRQETGNRMIGELRNVQRSRLRNDGYQSDSAMLDDEDEGWTPNTIANQRSISRKLNGSIGGSFNQNRPRASSVSERPFATIKRTYEYRNKNDNNHSHNDSSSSWTERSVSPGSAIIANCSSRPQTPAFPVHPRTPYTNNTSSPSVTFASDRNYANSNHINHSSVSYLSNNNIDGQTNGNYSNNADRAIYIEERRDVGRETGLPPKSPTMQRRLSFPENASTVVNESRNKRWQVSKQSSSFDYSKDRPVSPVEEISHIVSRSPGTTTIIQTEYGHGPKSATSYTSINSSGHYSPHIPYYGSGVSGRSSVHSNHSEPHEVSDANVKFVRDTSKIWYKPNISREQAIAMLRNAPPGTFVVRDSNSFPGAFGLALKVATPPPGVSFNSKDPSNELIRHFLIEPTSKGVRLKGCANEPVFSSLSALVYQHSLMAMALPCQLLLPEQEAIDKLDAPNTSTAQQLLAQGAACNVLYLFTLDTESLTGSQAVNKTITFLFDVKPKPSATIVHFKVSSQGITLTDNARKLFFRRHYPTNNISYCGMDPEQRTWDFVNDDTGRAMSAHRCFGFVARKPAHKSDNQCHIFAELEPEQPATAIVNFVNKVLGSHHTKTNIL